MTVCSGRLKEKMGWQSCFKVVLEGGKKLSETGGFTSL